MKAKVKTTESKVNNNDLIIPEKNSSTVAKKKVILKKKPKKLEEKETVSPNPITQEKKTSPKKTKEKDTSPKLEKLPGSLPDPVKIKKSPKELKYKYPEGLSKQEMKKFRFKLRKELKSLQEALMKLTQGTPEFEKKSKELEEFLKTNYNL